MRSKKESSIDLEEAKWAFRFAFENWLANKKGLVGATTSINQGPLLKEPPTEQGSTILNATIETKQEDEWK